MSGFDQPASEFFKAADYNGHLILCENIGARYTTNTSFGETDAINADVTVLTHPEGPKTFHQTAVFGAAMVGTLSRSAPGRAVLGRIAQGVAKAGQSAPWVLNAFDPATDAPTAEAFIQARAANQFAQPAQAAPAPQPVPQVAAPVPTVPQVAPVAVPQVAAPAVPQVAAPVPQVAPVAVPQVAPQPVAQVAPVAVPQVAPVAAPQPAAVAVAPGALTPEQIAALPPEVQAALAAQAATPPF